MICGRAVSRIGYNPTPKLKAMLVWEHFSEDDDRLRSGKQLCKTALPPTSVNGVPVLPGSLIIGGALFSALTT